MFSFLVQKCQQFLASTTVENWKIMARHLKFLPVMSVNILFS